MMKSEFIERTGFTPTAEEYAAIEDAYYKFPGNKDEFCKSWLKNKGILKAAEERQRKIEKMMREAEGNEYRTKLRLEALDQRIAELEAMVVKVRTERMSWG